MVSLIVNGSKINCPTHWTDPTITLRVFQRIINEWLPLESKDRLTLFSILTGKPFEFVMPGENHGPESLIHSVTSFVEDEGIPETEVPHVYKIGSRFVVIGKEIGQMTIGQNIQARQAMAKYDDPRAAMALVTAIYIQPYYDGQLIGLFSSSVGRSFLAMTDYIQPSPFSMKRARDIEKLLLDMPLTQIYSLGFFLLTRLQNSGMMFLLRWRRNLVKKIKSKMLLPLWRRSINLPVIMNFQ